MGGRDPWGSDRAERSECRGGRGQESGILGTGPTIANKIKGSKGPSPSFTAHPTILYLPGALVDALSIAESSWTAISNAERQFV